MGKRMSDVKTMHDGLLNRLKKLKEENEKLYTTREELLEKIKTQFMDYHKLAEKADELRKAVNERSLELNSQWYDAEKCLPWPNSSVII